MNDGGDQDKKKDLTGIFDLPQTDHSEGTSASGPEEFSVVQPIEPIDDFASLDQLGMMDHPEPVTETLTEHPEPLSETLTESVSEPPLPEPEQPVPPPALILDDLKNYSESSTESALETRVRRDFHLRVTGEFNIYSRDKLLLFITENPIGISSSELDFQIKSGRVLLPRISEFSGIKLIQELRDSGLSFSLRPAESSFESDSPATDDGPVHFSTRVNGETTQSDATIPIYPVGGYSGDDFQISDSIHMVQYLRAEILEVEKSELFQELLDRMTDALKRRAEIKGAHALTELRHQITPLRLPSQYQVELSASLLTRR